MSMISAQIDELRELAGDGSMEWVVGPVRASVLRDAADTIWELRDDLQRANAENAKLREQLERVQPTDCEGNVLDIADTVHMLRSEYDGDHEWEDVVTELVLTKWGGDRWIVRGSKGEAWACDCTKTGYDEDAYEASDDVEPFGEPTLLEVENAKLRKLVRDMYGFIERTDEECGDVTFSDCFDYCKHDATDDGCCKTGECWYEQRMHELGVEVDG